MILESQISNFFEFFFSKFSGFHGVASTRKDLSIDVSITIRAEALNREVLAPAPCVPFQTAVASVTQDSPLIKVKVLLGYIPY